MSEQVNLQEIERRAWSSAFEDGLWDIYLGLILLAGVVSELMSALGQPDGVRVPAYLSIFFLDMVVYFVGKRFVVKPRWGRVKFGPARRARINRLRVVIYVAVAATAVMVLAGLATQRGWFERPAWWVRGGPLSTSAVVAVFLLAVFGAMAYFFEVKRLYLYAALMALPEIGGALLKVVLGFDLGFLLLALAGALVMLAVGAVKFARFLRDTPPAPGHDHLPEGAVNG